MLLAAAISVINGNGYTALLAHEAQLDVLYDFCIPEYYSDPNHIGDGEEEKWYELVKNNNSYHLPHATSSVSEIKYYISETALDPYDSSSWDDITNSTRREYVKTSFINSLKKWNNVYFYKHTNNGFITKHRIVNITEGTSSNHNLTIYPLNEPYGAYASCGPVSSSGTLIDTQNGISHYHFSEWNINFNIAYHFYQTSESEHILNRTGAHEFGHVMGLRDIDSCENSSSQYYHHEEILMGYSNYYGTVEDRQSEITYKDLVGAAITRGYHTDNDHQWILHSSGHGAYKLVCAICNGVKYVDADTLNNLNYVDYKDCDDDHSLSGGNMFAVASYDNQDYYKCKYCRYVAPFTDIVSQNYTKSSYDSGNHLVTNQVTGLGYSFYESHTHNDHYINYSLTMHKAYCECGHYVLMAHVADMSHSYISHGHTYAPCLYCGAAIEIGGNGPIIPIPGSTNLMVTDNGSYIMENGIYVIVEEDLEAYLNGTLVFRPFGEVFE